MSKNRRKRRIKRPPRSSGGRPGVPIQRTTDWTKIFKVDTEKVRDSVFIPDQFLGEDGVPTVDYGDPGRIQLPPGEDFLKDTQLTTHELKALSKAARKAGSNLYLSDEDAEKLDSNRMHVLDNTLRVNLSGHRSYIRCLARLAVKGTSNRKHAIFDITFEHAAMLVEQTKPVWLKERERRGEDPAIAEKWLETHAPHAEDTQQEARTAFERSPRLGIMKPVWELSGSFEPVWESAELWADSAYDLTVLPLSEIQRDKDLSNVAERADSGQWYMKHSCFDTSLKALAALQRAHVVLIHPQQVAALPPWKYSEALRYSETCRPPFPFTYYDTELAGGFYSSLYARESESTAEVILRGAVAWKESDYFNCIPIGIPWEPDAQADQEVQKNRSYSPLATVNFNAHPDAVGPSPRIIEKSYGNKVKVLTERIPFSRIFRLFRCEDKQGWKVFEGEEDLTPEDVHGYADVAVPLSDLATQVATKNEDSDDVTGTDVMALHAWVQTLRVLSIQFLLDTPNVEIVEGGTPRQQKRADADNRQISYVVHISHNRRKYAYDHDASGEHIDFSHRFEVSGHYKHYPIGTRMADSKPQEVKSCPRCGRCRRIWTPPFIKGPDDKPFIPKVRVVRDDPNDQGKAA